MKGVRDVEEVEIVEKSTSPDRQENVRADRLRCLYRAPSVPPPSPAHVHCDCGQLREITSYESFISFNQKCVCVCESGILADLNGVKLHTRQFT